MKKYILSIATLCIIALASFAQNGITPLSEPFYDGTAMYLYNVHAQKFYTAGNEWGTRASIGDEGLKVYLEKYLVDGVWDGKTVIFRDSVPERNSIYEVFIDNEAGKVWVDRAEQPNYLWELTQSGSYYRFSMAAVCPDYESFYRPGTYLGWDSTLDEGNNSRLWAFMDPAISNHVDWVFMSEASYEAVPQRSVLQATIEQAKLFGIDVSAYELIANNSQATYDELGMAIENLQATINGFIIPQIQGATPSNPKDATSFIKNPQFTVDATAWRGEPVWGSNCAEKFNCNFDVYQNLIGLPNGYYKVSVQGFYRAGDGGSTSMDQHAFLYANEVSIPLMNINAHAGNEVFEGEYVSDVEGFGIVPNDMATASTAFSAGLYADNTLTVLVTDGTLRIGIKKESYIERDWTIFDNFELYYLGTESENAPLVSGTYYMKNVGADKYLMAANAWGTQASFGDHGLDVQITLANGKYTINTNVSNGGDNHFLGENGYVDSPVTEWTFIKQSNGTFAITTDGTNFIGYDGESSIMSLSLTDATSPNAQWQFVTKEELVEALSTASSGNPVDATFFIQGPNFGRNDGRNAAWQGSPAYGGEVGNSCAEKWNCNFDVYQDLTGLPNGYYKVSVQGFYRAGDGGSTSMDQHAFLYANEVSIPLMNINAHAGNAAFEGGLVSDVEGLGIVPNSMATASTAFSAGLYSDNTLIVQVTDGTLRIGIKKETLIERDWTIFDNFELYYLGTESEMGTVPLTADMFKTWDSVGADASSTGAATAELHVGEELGGGATVYGDPSVYFLTFADLTGYDKIVFEGTPGVQLRVLMNRVEHEGALIEVNPTIGEDGKTEVDLTDYEFVHLNAIKIGWGSPIGTVTAINLVKAAEHETPAGVVVVAADFEDGNVPFVSWHDNTRTVVDGVLEISIPEAVDAWDQQMAYDNSFEYNAIYTMKFKVKGSAAGSISANFQVTTDAYKDAGNFGAIEFGTEWTEFESSVTVSQKAADRLIFNLGSFAGTVYMDDFVLTVVRPEAGGPEVWTNILTNCDLEGEADFSFIAVSNDPNKFDSENGEYIRGIAEIIDGIGKDGSRGIKVKSFAGAAENWDAQFWIVMPQVLPAGTKYRISFDYRASTDVTVETEAHANPTEYIHYDMLGSIAFTPEWQHYEKSGVISDAQASNADGLLFKSIAFDLAIDKENDVEFYFDNIVFEVGEEEFALLVAVDAFNTLIVEVEIYQKTLDVTDPMQTRIHEMLTTAIADAKAAVEVKESLVAVNTAKGLLNSTYISVVSSIVDAEILVAEEVYASYKDPSDNAGLKTSIDKVHEIYNNIFTGMDGTIYTIADLNAAVANMKVAKDAFIAENIPVEDEAGRVSLQDVEFYSYDGWGPDAKKLDLATPEWIMNAPSSCPYGDPSVNNGADLSAFSKMFITVSPESEGMRIMMNRKIEEGQCADTEEASNLISIPSHAWCTQKYCTQEGLTYIIDLAKILKDQGFVRLHAIKGASWDSQATIESIELERATSSDITLDEKKELLSINFDDGVNPMMGWGNNSTNEVVDGVLKITNPSAVNSWEAQIAYDFEMPFLPDCEYTLTMRVRGSAPGQISIGLQNEDDNYASVGEFGTVDFDADWKDVEMTCLCNGEGGKRLVFSFGQFEGDIYIDDLKLLFEAKSSTQISKYNDAQGIHYQLNEQNTFTVTGYDETLVPDIVILENIEGKPVTHIKAGAFKNAYALKSVTISSSITNVGVSAFSGCHNLLVVKWNAVAPLNADCFDNPEEYGNMLVFVTNANLTRNYKGNVVVNGVAENIQLIDGRPFRNPQEFTAKKISYTRHFTKKSKVGAPAGWEGMVLPFDVQTITSETKGLLAPFGKSNLTSTRPFWMARWQTSSEWFTQSTVFAANKPFIIAMPNSDEYDESFNIEGDVIFYSLNTKVHTTDLQSEDGNFSLNGCYESVPSSSQIYALNDEEYTAPRGGGVFMPGGAFVANSRDIRPFEAYIYNAQLATTRRYIPVQGGGIATGIDRIMLKEGKQCVDVYTLQGIMVKHQIPVEDLEKDLPKGIYVVDGKKFVVK